MKIINSVKPCPFCGGKVIVTHGLMNVQFLFFKCSKCGAVVSFDNPECNRNAEKATDYFNRRKGV